jgi:hypothetical protein
VVPLRRRCGTSHRRHAGPRPAGSAGPSVASGPPSGWTVRRLADVCPDGRPQGWQPRADSPARRQCHRVRAHVLARAIARRQVVVGDPARLGSRDLVGDGGIERAPTPGPTGRMAAPSPGDGFTDHGDGPGCGVCERTTERLQAPQRHAEERTACRPFGGYFEQMGQKMTRLVGRLRLLSLPRPSRGTSEGADRVPYLPRTEWSARCGSGARSGGAGPLLATYRRTARSTTRALSAAISVTPVAVTASRFA